jgi:plastocyanin
VRRHSRVRRAASRREGGRTAPGHLSERQAESVRRPWGAGSEDRGAFPRGRHFVLAVIVGALLAITPVVASFATEPTIEAATGSYGYGFRWNPSTAEVKEGGTVAFQNTSTSVEHGVQWTGGPETPSCPGIPINEAKTSWKGTCTFTHPGTYTFRCVVHPTEMTATVTVSANGTATTTNTSISQQPPPPSITTTGATPTSSPAESPLLGTASRALKLAKNQLGGIVKGWIDVSKAGVGDRLEVEVFAEDASLARRTGRSRVGVYIRSSLSAGQTPFSVKLDPKARRALRRHHRLALTVKVALIPLYGTALTITRSVVARGQGGRP